MRYSGLVQVDLEDAEESGMLCRLRRLVRATCWLFRHWYLTCGLWELMALLPVLSVSAGTSREVLPGPMCVSGTHLDPCRGSARCPSPCGPGGCHSGGGVAGVRRSSCGVAVPLGRLSRSRVLQRV